MASLLHPLFLKRNVSLNASSYTCTNNSKSFIMFPCAYVPWIFSCFMTKIYEKFLPGVQTVLIYEFIFRLPSINSNLLMLKSDLIA